MKTNILLIQVDQMHAGCLSLLGNSNVHTPNLDALARQGVLFGNATCQSPICMPSRVSMLSGQYPSTNHQFGFTGTCDRRTPWLQGVLKQAGYRTGAFGKFHVFCIGEDQWDFDVAAPTLPVENDFARPAGNHYMAYCAEHGVPWPTDQMHANNPFGQAPQPPSSASPEMWRIRQKSCLSDVPLQHSLETWTTNGCLQFLHEQADRVAPFFVWLSYDRPHYPTTLPPEWFSRIDPDAVQLQPVPAEEARANFPSSLQRQWQHGTSLCNPQVGEETLRFILATYYTLINWLDSEVGRVLAVLRSLGLDEETTIIFTSDHGDEAGFHGLYDKLRRSSSQAVTTVALIIRPAPVLGAQASGAIHQEPVELVDLFPTICALTGIDAPPTVEGVDLSSTILKAVPLPKERSVVCEDYYKRMILRRGWKLVFDARRDDECQLFDLNHCPEGSLNLYGDAAVQEQRVQMKRRLLAFLMQRLHGRYTESDIERIQRGLDPSDPLLPLHWDGSTDDFAISFRAAAVVKGVVKGEDYRLLVPYYEAPMLLFKGRYQTMAGVLPMEWDMAERLLDKALRGCMLNLHPVSLHE